jgi:hypothetical protein
MRATRRRDDMLRCLAIISRTIMARTENNDKAVSVPEVTTMSPKK